MDYDERLLNIISEFLRSIKIDVIDMELPNDTFLPGIQIKGETILIDRARLKYPGDLLHEAGHIAVSDIGLRKKIGTTEIGDNWPSDGEEIAAILWSYAAAIHLNLDLDIVFHPDGYKNESSWLIVQFTNKNYIGLPLLEWMALCKKDEFPKMRKWMR
ncbi:hypothetical protein [Muriicola sp. Z0-33]|uniref:hypothetical protein n=1 Tax=Muriicola sp. Z0-33 TaxID=2816957 RepID=UPI00223743BD|nr:hypothetical protein [Muriicola sp. Z0-33]MCW5517886.1 hypothetical protein [Muriicola sp. Z0-33]